MSGPNQTKKPGAPPVAFLKAHTEILIKDLGYDTACRITGRSKATLGRYYSTAAEHQDRFIPINVVAALEQHASFPFVTKALADLKMIIFEYDASQIEQGGALITDVVRLSQRFATLMAEYNESVFDGVISLNEAKKLLRETDEIQRVLIAMKLHLEDETAK